MSAGGARIIRRLTRPQETEDWAFHVWRLADINEVRQAVVRRRRTTGTTFALDLLPFRAWSKRKQPVYSRSVALATYFLFSQSDTQ